MLRDIRPNGTKKIGIPKGYLFDYVTCPNYFFECLVWQMFMVINGTIASSVLLNIAFYQMTTLSSEKSVRLTTKFGLKKYPTRKNIIPYFI